MKQAVGIAVMGAMGCIDNSIPAAEMDTGEPTALVSDGAAPRPESRGIQRAVGHAGLRGREFGQ